MAIGKSHRCVGGAYGPHHFLYIQFLFFFSTWLGRQTFFIHSGGGEYFYTKGGSVENRGDKYCWYTVGDKHFYDNDREEARISGPVVYWNDGMKLFDNLLIYSPESKKRSITPKSLNQISNPPKTTKRMILNRFGEKTI